MSINLENVTAVQNENQEGVLGHLMWFSVGKQLIKTADLTERLIQFRFGGRVDAKCHSAS